MPAVAGGFGSAEVDLLAVMRQFFGSRFLAHLRIRGTWAMLMSYRDVQLDFSADMCG